MPGGRPIKYKPEYCEMLINWMSEGLSFESFAGDIGVGRSTIYDWCNAHEEFSDAKSIAMMKNLVFWEKMGIAGAAGRIKNFNSTTWCMNMKNRHMWRDKIETYEAETADEFNYPEGFE